MNIESTQKDIQRLVRSAARITQKNPQLAVLGALLFEATKDKVVIRATNLEIGAEFVLPAKVVSEGTVAIPAQVLASFVGTLGGDKRVVIKKEGDVVQVVTGQGTTSIKTLPDEDFPSLPRVSSGTSFSLPQKKLLESFNAVVFCASPSTIRPELASVYLRGDEHGLVSVATDSFRLAEKKVPVERGPVFDPILIPAKNVQEIIAFIEETENVGIELDEHHITFDTGKGFVTSRLTAGNFPDYTQILPKEFTTYATSLSADVTAALKKIAIFSDTFQKVAVHVNPEEKEFLFSSRNADIGETKENVSAALEGDEININFNYKYIHDVYNVVATDSTQFSFAGPQKPLLIQGVGDGSFLYIVMPMNR